MNTEITNLLTTLADKLGTTSEYLWGILLSQAPITATIISIQTIFTVVSGTFLWKLHKHFSKETDGRYSIYNRGNGGLEVLMTMFSTLILIIGIILFFGIADMLNGYFNPEYWALNKILNTLK